MDRLVVTLIGFFVAGLDEVEKIYVMGIVSTYACLLYT